MNYGDDDDFSPDFDEMNFEGDGFPENYDEESSPPADGKTMLLVLLYKMLEKYGNWLDGFEYFQRHQTQRNILYWTTVISLCTLLFGIILIVIFIQVFAEQKDDK